MSQRSENDRMLGTNEVADSIANDGDVPPVQTANGLASWITSELIEQTLEIWQPYYSYRLTREDAIVIIKNVGMLFEVMSRGVEE